jgi:hypothetical protein
VLTAHHSAGSAALVPHPPAAAEAAKLHEQARSVV